MSTLCRPQRPRRDADRREVAEQPCFIEPVIFIEARDLKARLDLTANLSIKRMTELEGLLFVQLALQLRC